MELVEIEGVWLNPDAVCLVRAADANEQGWRTEVILQAGQQLFKQPPEAVASALGGRR
jgi:hypothetical protein